ncbi:Mitochondrial matrix iron chaperone [Rhodosporidiobolus nylandii]
MNVARSATRQATRALRSAPSTAARSSSSFLAASSVVVARSAPLRTALSGCRLLSTSPVRSAGASYTIGELTDREYQDVADKTMDRLTEYLEEKVEELDIDGADVEYSSGVLTAKLGDKGTYVVNKQPPNKQIWLSSPISGPKRYDWDTTHRVWFYARDQDLMHSLLTRELRELLGDESIEVDLAEGKD